MSKKAAARRAGSPLDPLLRGLVNAVRDAGLEWTGEEIADTLWLASMLRAGEPEAAGGLAAPGREAAPTAPAPRPDRDRALGREPQQPPPDRDDAASPAAASRSVEVHVSAQSGPPGAAAGLRPVAFRVPAATALPDKLLISRSLRPLLRRVPEVQHPLLDETASVERSAELRSVLPVLRPGLERWLDVTVVVDEWHTMQVWRETVHELIELLQQLGAFRTVQTIYLRTVSAADLPGARTHTLRLFTGSARDGEGDGAGEGTGGRRCDPRELIDPAGRRLILVASDCTSPAWSNGEAARLLRQWTEGGMVTLVQMLPQRLWPGSALRAARLVYAGATTPGAANSSLEITAPRFSRGIDRTQGQPVPVVTLEPEPLRRWARLLAGMGREFVPAYWFAPAPAADIGGEPAGEPAGPEDLWNNFRAVASPAASELAGHLAAVPLSLPVMRLVQRVMMPNSRQVHLAEVMRGGLMRPLDRHAPETAPADIRYEFLPGVRSVLLDASLRSDTRHVLREVSGYIAQHIEQWRSFHALILDPTSPGDFTVDADTLPIASVTAEVLRHLGGSYRQLAERLESELIAAPGPSPDVVAAPTVPPAEASPAPAPPADEPEAPREPARPRSGPPVPMQKPPRVQHFTGREEELARLLDALRPGEIVTLSGPGGIGKTALAAEAVWRLAPGNDPPERFPDGVLFHTFYHQPQADAALESIARAYGVDPQPTPRDTARLALANRKALIVLDGTEAADDLEAVLSVAGGCGVLITTRRHSDAPAGFLDIMPLQRSESLQLLRQWAGEYAADDTAANEIVRLLGGLPLAVSLVGRYLVQRKQDAGEYLQWLQTQGVEALHFSERPSRSIPLLLRHSMQQVSDAAREAFGVAGVLELAPFDAEAIDAGLDLDTGAAHRFLGELVDYSLLLRMDDRYQVTHALAHSYARTQVAPSVATIESLALFYADRAKRYSEQGPTGFAALDRDRAHIVAVQAAALRAERWDAVREITWNTKDYLDLQGYWTDRITVVQAGLDAARAAGDRYDEGWFLNGLGLTYADLGETRRAIELYEQALVITREIGDRRGEGIAQGNLGEAYAVLGATHRAIEYHEQFLAIAREIGHRRGEGNALGSLGNAYAALGETRHAIELYAQCLAVLREIGDRSGEGVHLGNLGEAYADLGETRRAIEYQEQALAIAREIGHRRGESEALGNLGLAYAGLGETRRAIEYQEQALAIARQIGNRRGEGNALVNLGLAYAALGDNRRAMEYQEQALAIARETGDRHSEGVVLSNLGNAYAALDDNRRAIEYQEQALAIARGIGDRRAEGSALGNLGEAYAALGDNRHAIELYERRLSIAREIGDRRGEAITSWNLGKVYAAQGDFARAAAMMQLYTAYLQEIGYPDAAKRAEYVEELKRRGGM